jgi:hypoxanthine phosphoribosyltransferase
LRRRLRVLIPEERIRKRVEELGREIPKSMDSPVITVVSLLKGALVFTADLVRHLRAETEVDFFRVTSYSGKEKGKLQITYRPEIPLKGKHVLIVDDIFDTGETLHAVYSEILKEKPLTVKTCVLLDKEVEKGVNLKPDFVGFRVPNYFVFGYGLDLNEMYRDLPYIGYFEGDGNE